MKLKGKKMSEEHKRKIGEANKKSHLGLSWGKHTDEYKKKMSEFKKNYKVSEETKKKLKNRKHTSETKEKIRQSKLGKKQCTEFILKRISKLIGKKHSVERCAKAAEIRRGDKSHFWKGGRVALKLQIRNNYKYRQWRSDVFTRDNYTCQECGSTKGGTLNADHIYPLAKLLDENNIKTFEDAEACEKLWDINNGRTLCVDCHKKTPTYALNLKYYK